MEFHTDSVWTLDASPRCDNAYTGGKDGNIFKIDILNDELELVSKGSPQSPIITLAYDNRCQKLWYST